MKIRTGKLIPRDDGKRIEELVGNATTKTASVSVARMLAPPGWSEPAQQPEFDEVVLVLRGELTLAFKGRTERIRAGETGLVPRGQKITYRNDATVACDYFSICAPAFRPDLAHVERAKPRRLSNAVHLEIAHPKGRAFARSLERDARRFLQALELNGCELSISLVTDRAIRRLNRTWRRKDKATDVLSFPAGELPRGTPGPRPLGDIVISLDTARAQAIEYARTEAQEIERYLAHGLLHLLGHDHEKARDAKKMASLEVKLLGAPGMIS